MTLNSTLSQPKSQAARLPVLAVLLATLALCLAQILAPAGAHAATLSLDQCNNNGPGPTGATTSMQCTVVVVNTIDGAQSRVGHHPDPVVPARAVRAGQRNLRQQIHRPGDQREPVQRLGQRLRPPDHL